MPASSTDILPRTPEERWQAINAMLRSLRQIVTMTATMDQETRRGLAAFGQAAAIDRQIDTLLKMIVSEANQLTVESLYRTLAEKSA